MQNLLQDAVERSHEMNSSDKRTVVFRALAMMDSLPSLHDFQALGAEMDCADYVTFASNSATDITPTQEFVDLTGELPCQPSVSSPDNTEQLGDKGFIQVRQVATTTVAEINN